MSISFQCEHCGKTLRVADDRAGKTGPCPACKGRIRVPAPAAAPAYSSSSPSSSADESYDLVEPGEAKTPRAGASPAPAATKTSSAPAPAIAVGRVRRRKVNRVAEGLAVFRFLGLGLRGWFILILVVGAGAGAYYWLTGTPPVTVGATRLVDVYVSLPRVRDCDSYESGALMVHGSPGLVTNCLVFANDGGDIAVLRDDPNAGYFIVPVTIRQSYLVAHKIINGPSILLDASSFELAVGGQTIHPRVVAKSFTSDGVARVDTDASLYLDSKRRLAGRGAGKDVIKIETPPDVVERPNGMQVRHSQAENSRVSEVRWDSGSEGCLLSSSVNRPAAILDFTRQEFLLVFPRQSPAAATTADLKVFGETFATINLP